MALNPSAQIGRMARRPYRAQKKRRLWLWLNQQGYEADKQRATEDHGPVPDIEIEKPVVRRHESELHARPLPLNDCSITACGKRSGTVKIDGGSRHLNDARCPSHWVAGGQSPET